MNLFKKIKFISQPVSYRTKLIIIGVGFCIGIASFLFFSRVVNELKAKERKEVGLWAYAIRDIGNIEEGGITYQILVKNNTIPFVIIDDYLSPKSYHLIDRKIINDPEKLREYILKNTPNMVEIRHSFTDEVRYIYYGESILLRNMVYFPYIQLSIIFIFIIFSYITFRASRNSEQNRVWIGMAKETAHQLGTPTSSLLGWIEYLKQQNADPLAVEQMSNDLKRLLTVVDRFSKIGSPTGLTPCSICDIVDRSVEYFKLRIPKNVDLSLDMNSCPQVMVNESLFEWVIENLLKNAIDAVSGKGMIRVYVKEDNNWVYIDVSDSGKGIPKSQHKRIFQPGFSTKTRGWGLGLSLSRRIVEEYHKGRIFVLDSEIDRGTTMRVMLSKKLE